MYSQAYKERLEMIIMIDLCILKGGFIPFVSDNKFKYLNQLLAHDDETKGLKNATVTEGEN